MQTHVTVTFLTLLSRLPYQINTLRTCVPNSQFILNNYLCYCNSLGLWNDANCKIIQRRHICHIGQIVREGCNRCVCQDNGQFSCTNAYCLESPPSLSAYDAKCTPFRSYYINCSLCTCPASGLSSEAHCTKDASCPLESNYSDFPTVKNNYCIPNVMYIFPCIQCLCSENGFFVRDKCVEKCQETTKKMRRCIPGTYFRNDCDICFCPENGNPDKNLCTRTTCNNNTNQPVFQNFKNYSVACAPFTFINPICLFCDCTFEGTINHRRCVELDCSNTYNFQNYPHRYNCSPGEAVPNCIACFCPRNGLTSSSYCTNVCTYQSKLDLLKKIVNRSLINLDDVNKMGKDHDEYYCDPNTVYNEDEKYCLCPENGYKSFKSCISFKKVGTDIRTHESLQEKNDKNTPCEPGTYVELDCNVCYCSKSGKIDRKWCTYDDCVAKKTIQAAHKSRVLPVTNDYSDGTCTPGSISKVKCNFCICPESGKLKERACTRNNCYEEDDQTIGMDRFTCEPLAYYEVDCNICFCPRDGIKNVAKCTKNHCEKNFLRFNDCTPGHLFSDVCNVCVCPPNGDKTDKACTKHTCGVASWNQFKLSQSLLQNKINNETTRTLDHCFPGEEFTDGCKICVCPEMGLKMYASCEANVCDDVKENLTSVDMGNKLAVTGSDSDVNIVPLNRIRRFELNQCMEYKITVGSERHDCTPGSMYFVRCKQCICPYMGNINLFCRPLPSTVHCEQAYPGFNYLPMGRRLDEGNVTRSNKESTAPTNETVVLEVTHEHTKYRCEKIGKILDNCFICNCEEDPTGLVVIEEHCFRNDADNCTDAKPSFLVDNKLVFL